MRTAKQRKADERSRMKTQGLRRFEAWVHPDDFEAVRAYIDRKNMARKIQKAFASK